jgi:hypothetical protein
MFLKSSAIVLFLAFAIFAAPENVTKTSSPFIFQQGIGVLYPKVYSVNGMTFTYKKITAGKQSMSFSWSLPKTIGDAGKLSLFTLSGKMIKSYDVTSPQGSHTWSMAQGKIGSGVYFARLTYGKFNKSLKVMF